MVVFYQIQKRKTTTFGGILMKINKAESLLLFSAFAWGISGILTQVSLTTLTPMAIIFIRFIIAATLGVFFFKINPFGIKKSYYFHSLNLSLLLTIIYISSTYGLKYTTASNAGFIIGSAVVLVPLFNRFFFKETITLKTYFVSFICFIGLALVTLKGKTQLNIGDFYCFIDAIAYAFYIIYNSRLSKTIDSKKLISLQYVFVSLFIFIYLIVFESLSFTFTTGSLVSIVILGSICTFLAFLFQLKAQQSLSAERSSQILTLMPVFTLAFDYFAFNTTLTYAAALGGFLIVASTLLIKDDEKIILIES